MSARVVSTVTAGWLETERPGGLIGEIRSMDSRESQARPLTVVLVEDGESAHPKLRVYQVTLRGDWRPADDPAGHFPAALKELADVLLAEWNAGLRPELAQQGLLLRRVTPGVDREEVEGDTGRRWEMPFRFLVQTGL